jgi:hypothetical protein
VYISERGSIERRGKGDEEDAGADGRSESD